MDMAKAPNKVRARFFNEVISCGGSQRKQAGISKCQIKTPRMTAAQRVSPIATPRRKEYLSFVSFKWSFLITSLYPSSSGFKSSEGAEGSRKNGSSPSFSLMTVFCSVSGNDILLKVFFNIVIRNKTIPSSPFLLDAAPSR